MSLLIPLNSKLSIDLEGILRNHWTLMALSKPRMQVFTNCWFHCVRLMPCPASTDGCRLRGAASAEGRAYKCLQTSLCLASERTFGWLNSQASSFTSCILHGHQCECLCRQWWLLFEPELNDPWRLPDVQNLHWSTSKNSVWTQPVWMRRNIEFCMKAEAAADGEIALLAPKLPWASQLCPEISRFCGNFWQFSCCCVPRGFLPSRPTDSQESSC